MGPVGTTPAPNNDDAPGASPNAISYSIFFNSPGALETEFVLSDSGGTTEYLFNQLFINNSNWTWTGFRFELGYGTGANFVRSQPADVLMFDGFENRTTANSSKYNVTVDQKTLEWNGPALSRISSVSFSFAIDVPDDLTLANPNGTNRFTLRQTPLAATASSAPEPATAGLIGMALAALGRRIIALSERDASGRTLCCPERAAWFYSVSGDAVYPERARISAPGVAGSLTSILWKEPDEWAGGV